MREDPIISGAWIRAALVVLLGGALGVGAYLLASDVDINLPDLDLSTTGDESTLSDTTVADTTIGEPEPPPPATKDPFTSAGFASALAKVRDAVGHGAQVTQVSVNDVQTQFFVRRGKGGEAYSVRADSGELQRQEATITITGNATIEDFAFGLNAVRPSAIDRMLPAARKLSGTADFDPTVLNLERRIPAGSRELAWTINAQGGGRNLTYRARANGTGVEVVGGSGTAIPPEIQRAQELNRCIQAAAGDIDEINACFDRFSP